MFFKNDDFKDFKEKTFRKINLSKAKKIKDSNESCEGGWRIGNKNWYEIQDINGVLFKEKFEKIY